MCLTFELIFSPRSLPEVSETDELDEEEDEMYDEFDSGGGGGNDCCGCNQSGNWSQQTPGNWSQQTIGNPVSNFNGKLLLDDLLMINHDSGVGIGRVGPFHDSVNQFNIPFPSESST